MGAGLQTQFYTIIHVQTTMTQKWYIGDMVQNNIVEKPFHMKNICAINIIYKSGYSQ